MSKLRTQMMRDLERARYTSETKRKYVSNIARLAQFFGRCPSTLTSDDLRDWLDHLAAQGASARVICGHIDAIRFFFRRTLGKPDVVAFLVMPKRPRKLPRVLSLGQVESLLNSFRMPRYRVLFATV